jgi:hypothetical protein
MVPPLGVLPEDFVTSGADADAAWTSVSVKSAPPEMDYWEGMPVEWSGGWMVNAYGNETRGPLIWLSGDGRSWHAAGAPANVLPGPGGLVAFDGSIVWKSADGIWWSRSMMTGFYPNQSPGFVGGEAGLLTRDLYFSPDAIAWSAVKLPKPAGARQVASSAAFQAGQFIVVETLELASGEIQNSAFVSADGQTWMSSILPLSGNAFQIVSLYDTDAGILAEFRKRGDDPSHWLWSKDAAAWQGATDLNAMAASRERLSFSIQSNGERFLVVDRAKDGEWVLSTSIDGLTWTNPQARVANAKLLDLELAPHGIYFSSEGGCLDFLDKPGYCFTPAPGAPYYGAAR